MQLGGQDFAKAFNGKRVLLTGHTGFKGGWLAAWLSDLGANVCGIALPPRTASSLYNAVRLPELIHVRTGDIRSADSFNAALNGFDAELVIHMAAQALVRPSYDDPVDTFHTNVTGTAVVLDAARKMPSLRGVVVVTSDKCYENNEWVWGYRETDALGGVDPYSASKACAELVASSFRRSYFSGENGPLLASVRAGNVFGGGDWSQDRLIPDLVRAVEEGKTAHLRNPASIRPWQHVLEPLSGYLTLSARLLAGDRSAATAWNFGPDASGVVDVKTMAVMFRDAWPDSGLSLSFGEVPQGPHEAGILKLDSSNAKLQLQWHPKLDVKKAVELTVAWYRAHASGSADMRDFTLRQIRGFAALGARS
jgi:CDP-glucose 4,6-dehydratase